MGSPEFAYCEEEGCVSHTFFAYGSSLKIEERLPLLWVASDTIVKLMLSSEEAGRAVACYASIVGGGGGGPNVYLNRY